MMAKKTILVVDDKPAMRTLYTRILTRAGYEVIACDNAETALTAYHDADRPGEFDLVITDVSMPGSMNGIVLARTILELRPTQPIIVASGNDAYLQPAIQSGIPTLKKPFDRNDLLVLVEANIA